MKYNPGFLSDDELVSSFRVRTREFRAMVETVRGCTGDSNTHMLVVGPRGSGKTTLLLRVAAELRRDHTLSRRFFPITLAEETYNVSTCGEFWLEVLNRLAHQAPHRPGDPDYQLSYQEVCKSPDDQSLAGRSLGRLLEFADRERKRLVVFVENLNAIFSDLVDRKAGWQLRHTLQTEARILLVTSATSRFEAIDNPGEALYDFFQVRKLWPLDEIECTDLWEGVSGERPTRSTIRSLQILTGGSPRLLAIIARFGASLSFDDLMSNLLELVDDHTEYFRSHLESLASQQRRVFLALAGLWRPATTKEIAQEARIATNQCSAQLKRLEALGAVSVVGGSPRRMTYYLTERMFNIYYLLRLSGRASDLVRALVRFMQSYYSLPKQVQVAHEIAQTMASRDTRTREIARDTLTQLLEGIPEHLQEPPLRAALTGGGAGRYELPEHGDGRPREYADGLIVDYAIGLVMGGRFEEAIRCCDEIARRHRASRSPETLAQVAQALAYKGVARMGRERYEAALDTFENVDRRFRYHESAAILDSVAMALVNKGICLGRLNRLEEALESHAEVVSRFGAAQLKSAKAQVACALYQTGLLLNRKQCKEEAVGAYDDLMRRFGPDKEHSVSTWVTRGYLSRAHTLGQLGRLEEALSAFDSFELLHRGHETPEMEEWNAKALAGKAWALERLDRLTEALVTCDSALERFGSSATASMLEPISHVLLGKASVLEKLDRTEEALAAYDEIAGRFNDVKDPIVVKNVATGLVNKGAILAALGRMDEATTALNSATARCSDIESDDLSELTETALLNRALVEGASGKPARAVETATQVLDRVPKPDSRKRMRALFIRAFWEFHGGAGSAGERDIAGALRLLPECSADLAKGIDWLIRYTGTLGYARVLELIKASPAQDLLLALSTALEQELGRKPRVAIEVEEVARDIRHRLKALRESPSA